MYKPYKKMFSGALLIFFDINIGIDILPDTLGYLFLIAALNDLYKKTELVNFNKAKLLLYPLIPLSFYNMFNTINLDELVGVNRMALVISITLSALAMFYFYTATEELINEVELYNEIKTFKNIYVYSNLLVAFILTLNNFRTFDIYLTVVFIVFGTVFFITIAWVFNLRKLKNYFMNQNDDMDMGEMTYLEK